MRLFGFTLSRGEQKNTGTWGTFRDFFAQLNTRSGVAVNWQTAAQVSTAFACARVIAEGLSQVPFRLYRDLPGGGKEAVKDHALAALWRRPNAWQTSFEFREMLGLHLVFAGNAYVWKNRVSGNVVELLPYAPNQVTVVKDGWNLSYRLTLSDGKQITVAADDIWHLRGPSWDAVVGLDAVKLAREAIGLALATEEHSSRMFSNGARVGGVLSTDSSLKQDQVDGLRKSWEQTQGGVANAFKTAILWGGLKWSPMAMSGVDAQHLEQRRFQVEEICRHLRVMPIMIGHTDKTATYASAEQMFLAHVVHTLGPWYARIEQSADAALLSDDDRDAGYYHKFLPQALMRGAHKDRAEYFAKALGSGGSPAWMTQDEVRELDELNPLGGTAAALPIATNVGGNAPQPTA